MKYSFARKLLGKMCPGGRPSAVLFVLRSLLVRTRLQNDDEHDRIHLIGIVENTSS